MDEQKLKENSTTKPALQMIKELFYAKKTHNKCHN